MQKKIYYFFGLSEPSKPGNDTTRKMADAMYRAAEGRNCEIIAAGFSNEMAGAVLSGTEDVVNKLATGIMRRARKAFKVHRTILLDTRELLKNALMYVISSNTLIHYGDLYGLIEVRKCLRLKKNFGISERMISKYNPRLFILMVATNRYKGASDEAVGRYMTQMSITRFHRGSPDKCPDYGKEEIILETTQRYNTCASQMARVSGISVSEIAGILLKSRP